jgi:hypothetical protein
MSMTKHKSQLPLLNCRGMNEHKSRFPFCQRKDPLKHHQDFFSEFQGSASKHIDKVQAGYISLTRYMHLNSSLRESIDSFLIIIDINPQFQ